MSVDDTKRASDAAMRASRMHGADGDHDIDTSDIPEVMTAVPGVRRKLKVGPAPSTRVEIPIDLDVFDWFERNAPDGIAAINRLLRQHAFGNDTADPASVRENTPRHRRA